MLADTAVAQIDAVLTHYQGCVERSKSSDTPRLPLEEAVIRLKAAIDRLSSRDSEYRRSADKVLIGATEFIPGMGVSVGATNSPQYKSQRLAAILTAMKADFEAGYMRTFSELIHADLFSDFLEMAEHLVGEGYKDPAAVLAGSVLEEHLRKLCEKNRLPVIDSAKPIRADRLNANLKTADVYSTLELKQVTAWLDLRNKAAHGKYGEYAQPQVELMISGVRDFLVRNPA